MNKSALLLLAIVAPSCGGTSAVLFKGEDSAEPRSGLAIVGKKSSGRIRAFNPYLGFVLQLPYAEDWFFEPTDQKPLFGKSTSLLLFATVQSHRPGKAVEEESYLRDEYLKNLRSNSEGRGLGFKDVALARRGNHFVLEYATEKSFPDGTPLLQTHFWTFRQDADGVIYEAHVSTVQQKDPARAEMCETLRDILGKEFLLLPKMSR
jgi:hypothetical protein